MKKILLNESERKAAILDREKAIVENFAKTFNKIKRLDENEVKPISESLLAIGGAVVLAGIVAKAVGTIKNNMLAKRFEKTGEKEEVKGPKGGNLIMYGYKDKKDGKHYWGFDFKETRGDAGNNEINTMLFNDDTAASVKNYIVKDGSGQRPTGEEGAEGHHDDYFGPYKSDVKIYRGTDENEVKSNNVSPEALVDKAVDKMEHDSSIPKVAQQIANDPKAMAELQKVLSNLGINVNEGVGINPEQIALAFVKKSGINEDAGAGFWTGLLGGGALAHYIYSVPAVGSVIAGASTSPMTETMIGAIIGATLGVLAAYIYQKRKANNSNQA